MRIWIKRLLWFTLTASIVLGGWAAYAYRQHVVLNPGEHIDKSYILRALSKESAVYYRDGQTQMHAFYSDHHRIYIPYNEIPEYWVQAITASEDKRYFSHFGLDPIGITRAMLSNIKAGRIVSGGSTLTQQTAKNVFNRPDRSLNSKAEEALNALRLEHHFSKEDILEFYANQFHVNGNGRGIGVAARHYFDKQAKDLTLIECAFIAGMLQGPGLFDPFVSRSYRKGMTVEEYRALNIERAQKRVAYVLGRMLIEGHISQELHDTMVEQPLPFKRGVFQYSPNATVDEIKKRLLEEPFSSLLQEYHIDNPATAGLKIVTTIDQDIQRHAQYGLVHHLTEVGSVLEGVERSDLIHDGRRIILEKRRDRGPGDLFFAKVVEETGSTLTVKDGNGECIVDSKGLQRISKVLKKAKGTKWGRTQTALLSEISDGDVLWLSVRSIEDGQETCDIELTVELQGGVLALHKGEILAMVGGSKNMDFNRASNAKRQFGSTWKPLIYTAALQLGWSPLDILDNRGNPFPFERVWYYPRSGHKNAAEFPTLSWTGVHSENRSSVWLLFHLTDKLNIVDYQSLIEKVGLSMQEDEDEKAYIKRIRDDLGVISTRANLNEVSFLAAKREVINSSFMEEQSSWTPEDVVRFQSLLFGRGAERELEKLKDPENKWLTAQNYQTLKPVVDACVSDFESEVEQLILDPDHSVDKTQYWRVSGGSRIGCGEIPSALTEVAQPLTQSDWLIWAQTGMEPELWIQGAFSHLWWEKIEQEMKRQQLLLSDVSPYSMDFIQHHPDFQLILNMRYCNYLLNNLGVEGTLPLTLTMPLGAVELTLLDAAMLYNGLLTGQRTKVEDDSDKGNVLIERIEGPTGEVLFEAKPQTQQVSNFVSGMLLSNILHNVVEHGTGRRARKLKTDEGVSIPVVGKTGTTNGYRNAAFVGMVPKAESGTWELMEGVTVATYVGFDDNTPMRFGRTTLSGASGALPVWMETVRGIGKSEFIGYPKEDMDFTAPEEFGFHSVEVDRITGYALEEGTAETWIYNPNVLWGQEPSHIRAFAPVDAEEVPQWKEPLTVLKPTTPSDLTDVRLVPSPIDVLPSEQDSGGLDFEPEDLRLPLNPED